MTKTYLVVCIIAGTRFAKNYKYVVDGINASGFPIGKVIEGGAPGVDGLAKLWAVKNKVPYEEIKADWKRYGHSAGFIRNGWMLERPDPRPTHLIALPGIGLENKGTNDMIRQATGAGLTIFVQEIEV